MALKRTPAFHVSSACAGRANLMPRMGSRRFTRLANALFKRVENHTHPIASHTMHCGIEGIHRAMRCTLAMAADMVNGPCELADMVQVSRKWEARGRRGFGH